MPSRASQRQAIKAQFRATDTSGDGRLDIRELAVLLKKGDPRMQDDEIRRLFRGADQNHDGKIDFHEFVDFIFNMKETEQEQEDDGAIAPEIKAVYEAFTGGSSQMNHRQFARLCKDCAFHNASFKQGDTELVFSRVKRGHERTIGIPQFLKACEIIAEKRGCQVTEIFHALEIQGAPMVATSPSGRSEAASLPSPARRYGDSLNRQVVRLTEDDMETKKLLDTYMRYASGRNGDMDVRMFAKCLKDSGLVVDRSFTAHDIDILFAEVCKRSDRRITFTEFHTSLSTVAAKKGCSACDVEAKIMDCTGQP